ncbi:MAG: DUF952 domain-containing protein [Acidobacteria bacterium]|nr:DUF952 domain-containing protein [Acidobacteriota bacterium]
MMAWKRLYRILGPEEWRRVEGAEWFAPAELAAGGFIHLCTADQLGFVAARHFAGAGRLLVMEIDAEAIAGDVQWEESEVGLPPFPHCYGPIPRTAIVSITELSEFAQAG